MVIKSALGSIISNLQQYEQYKRDADSGIKIMEAPEFVSEKGRGPNEFPKTLDINNFGIKI